VPVRLEEGNEDTASVKVRESIVSTESMTLVPLKDSTFLVAQSSGGGFVIRFDQELNTRYKNKRLVIADADQVNDIVAKLPIGGADLLDSDGQKVHAGYNPQLLLDRIHSLIRP
jgi:hypothetical protein